MEKLSQESAPIYEALEKFRKMRVVPFDVPGHKRGRGNPELERLLGDRCMNLDVNSMKPLDNLCHPVSVIRQAEELAAEAFHAAHAFLMVGGTTSSVQSMILSVAKRGEKIILPRNVQDGNISEVKAMHIRDREFDPFAFRINDNALPEIVDDYVFQQPKQDRNFSLTELTEQQHREALENGFGKQVVQGYSNVIAALKQGYASIGYERGRNVLVSLNKFLVNKRMIVKEGKGYRYNPDFHY